MSHAFSGVLVRYCPMVSSQSQKVEASEQSALPPKDELHVNLWEVGPEAMLDIGIKISDFKSLSAVQVDLPWTVAIENVSDLGSRLNTEKSLAAIFNEVVLYSGCAGENFATVTLRKDSRQTDDTFLLARLSQNAFSVEPYRSFDGKKTASKLNIQIPASFDFNEQIPSPLYIRFRIRAIPRDVYSTLFKQKDRGLLSSSIETKIVDFRINVRRGTPDEILATSPNVQFPRFKKIHFFLTTDREKICDFTGQSFVGCRSLVDEEIWNQYINDVPLAGQRKRANVRDYLGYQWSSNGKDNGVVKDLLVLGRFSKSISDKIQIGRFVVLVLILGMLGNAAWDIMKDIFGYKQIEDFGKLFYANMVILSVILICLQEWDRWLISLIPRAFKKVVALKKHFFN